MTIGGKSVTKLIRKKCNRAENRLLQIEKRERGELGSAKKNRKREKNF